MICIILSVSGPNSQCITIHLHNILLMDSLLLSCYILFSTIFTKV